MKLAKFDTVTNATAGIEVELYDIATGTGSGAFIRVLGTDSAVCREATAERSRRVVERIRAREGKHADADETDADDAELLAACTAGWRGLENDDGTDLVFTRAQARALYLGYPLIKEQVDRAIADRGRFIKG